MSQRFGHNIRFEYDLKGTKFEFIFSNIARYINSHVNKRFQAFYNINNFVANCA